MHVNLHTCTKNGTCTINGTAGVSEGTDAAHTRPPKLTQMKVYKLCKFRLR